jgi:hypothetical protein
MSKKKSGGSKPPMRGAGSGKPPMNPMRGAAKQPAGFHFYDVHLLAGRITSRHEHDTDKLAPQALALCRRAALELRKEALVSTPVVGIGFSLGLPDSLFRAGENDETADNARAAGRYFGCHAGSAQEPFLVNAILVGDESPTDLNAPVHEWLPGTATDGWVLSTLIGLSAFAGENASMEAREALYAEIMSRRPCLVSTHYPLGLVALLEGNARETVSVGADAATCMAAVLLQECHAPAN